MEGCTDRRILTTIAITAFVLLSLIHPSTQNSRRKREIANEQPRILTQDGHMLFQTGSNHNISFRSVSGGFINFDGENFKAIVQTVKENQQQIQEIKDEGSVNDVTQRLDTVESRLDNLQPTGEVGEQLTDLNTHLTDLTQRLDDIEDKIDDDDDDDDNEILLRRFQLRLTELENRPPPTLPPTPTSSSGGRQMRRVQRRLTTVENQLSSITTLLETDECASNPCRNGGECVDAYDRFWCRCPKEWEGVTCEQDVNECSIYQGTDLGCQNGGTCVNLPGSFRCECPADYHGIRCTEQHNDCTGASQEALCGHGTCVNQPRDDQSQRKYKCICDEGWTTDGSNPECTTDVNECDSPNPPCSVDPEVMCINLPGSFTCGPCPTGFTGNGYVCTDINECLINNGGCSMNPMVECINTRGSRTCGPCPTGYVGDGVTCHYVGICNMNNGGCYPQATCTENSNVVEGRTCTCPSGTVGNGVGASGCVSTSGDCSSNPCVHGTCVPSGMGYVCICDDGWEGVNCQIERNDCASNPCQNGGMCIKQSDGYMCNCTSSYTGTNCEEEVNACGGFLNGDVGTLKYPATEQGDGYPHDVSCAWVITVSTGKIVMLRFINFDLEVHPSCDFDFLQIHDGPNPSSHMIGQYCGNELPGGGVINSTHNQLYLWFRSDSSVSHDGFEFIWQAAVPVCGGDIRGADFGVIHSPGYPGDYPHNADCVWTVAVSLGNKIQFSFGEIAIEHHLNCSYDYLAVYDGLLDTDRMIAQYCDTQSPPPLTTTGPYARLHFHSDASYSDKGFEARYSTVPAYPGCGGHFTDDSAIIISPNYPNDYPHNAQCVWTVTVPSSEVIEITFTNIQIEYHEDCIWDYVEIRDGLDETAPLAGKYCGTVIPAPYRTTQNNAFIRFRSDSSSTGAGFRLSYVVACGGVFTEPTGSLQSPYYPESYPDNKICEYLIMAPANNIIVVTFTAFDVEDATSSGLCQFDYLAVHNGAGEDSPQIGKYCGSAIPGPIQSNSNNLWMKFKSDGSVSNHGFLATYEFQDSGTGGGDGGEDGSQEGSKEDCGGTLTEDEGTFSSPGHPNNYPHGVNCSWFITVSPGSVIRLTFDSFNLEYHDNCNYDYVEIFDSGYTNSLGKYCGSTGPPVLTSTDNTLKIQLVSDDSIAVEGFSASYVAINATTVCGGTFIQNTGMIHSPDYPNNYPHNRQCEYIITVDEGQQIMLNATVFEIENHAECRYDYLEIRNGGYETSPLIGRYCGTQIDPDIRSDSNRMYLKFVSDSSQSAKGFQIFYDGTTSGCGGELTAPTGSFVSPGYPMRHGHNAECYWTITISRGSIIELSFLDFDIEYVDGCYYDYVQVRDSSSTGVELGKFCGSTNPDPIRSKTNRLWIKFRTDYSNAGNGFHATYTSDCNVNLTSHYGVIESPNFPGTYPHNRDCVWRVMAAPGNTINASFSHFQVEQHESCLYDYVELRDGLTENDTLIGHYCGLDTIIPAIATTSSNLYLRFKSDASLGYNGFRMEYIMNGCGGSFTSPSGGFTSPNYPNPYQHNRVCSWNIAVESGNSIRLVLHDLDLESHVDCEFDKLEIFGGIDDGSPLLAKLCDTKAKEQVLTSTSNYMYVRFTSDVNNAGKGFNATYTTVDGGCGGDYSVDSATITSKNYPGDYPYNAECLWNIMVDEGHAVEFTFNDFDLEGHEDCRYDYVALFDGDSNQSPNITKVCGNELPDPNMYTSTDNKMFIEMRSDSSVSGYGFNGTYVTACGGHLAAETDGEIFSPGWPGKYLKNKNCTWIIEAAHPSDHVTLTFTHIDVEDTNDCAHDYVRVLEGNNPQAPVLNTYCGTRIPPSITSQGSALTVIFVSDASDERGGFRATYTKSISSCGANLTSEHGAFSSPGYPNSYPNNVECVWFITSSPGNNVHLSFSFFQLESSDYCNHDYVEVRKEHSGGELMGRYCDGIPANLTNGHNLWVKFKSNEAITGQGFMAQYNSIYGGAISGTSGQVASPLYPGNYPHRANYAWVITAPSDLYIRVSFVDIDIEDSTMGCVYDWVAFKDGGEADLPEMARYCGVEIPPPVHSSGNQLRVEFITDYSSNGKGFLFNWDTVSVPPTAATTPGPTATPLPGCGADLFAQDAALEFNSPGYPNGYDHNLDCQWLIQAPLGYRVWFNISDIWLEGHMTECSFDAVKVFDGAFTYSYMLGKFCDRAYNEVPLISSSNQMLVTFTTDSSVNRTGFLGQYRTACGGHISASTGTIQSPGFPDGYPDNSNCTWYINVLNGRTIQVTFESFDIESSGSCSGQYLQFLNGASTSSPPLGDGDGKYCGSSVPSISETDSNYMVINFVAIKGSQSHMGFKLNFHEVEVTCGGHLTLTNTVTSGIITSPNYPEDYPHNVDCVWIVTAPGHELIQLDFDDFEIEQHHECVWDFVESRDGGTVNSPLLQRSCGKTKPSTVKTTGNVMYIRFRTDISMAHKGFKATYKIAECGGFYNGDSGSLTSPNFPGNYDNNLDCGYYISGTEGHYLTLTFETLAVQPTINCTADYILIHEINATGRVLGRYCGGVAPEPIDTPSSYAYIRFVTDDKDTYQGFKMNFQASVETCGGELTAPTGTLASPNYPGVYAHERLCEWHIRVAPSRRVTLTFNDLGLEHGDGCPYDYVAVYNGLMDESPVLTKVCGDEIPDAVKSSGNTMRVVFYTDFSINGGGFSATYTSDEAIICGGLITSVSTSAGTIQSPGYNDDEDYPNNEQCVWEFFNADNFNSSINIQFNDFNVEPHGECQYDFIEIREGYDETAPLIGRYCGNDTVKPAVTVPTNALWMAFVSDSSLTDKGFKFHYKFTACGGVIMAESGVITSPNYPENYDHNDDCVWHIIAPEGHKINTHFTNFEIERHNLCNYDYVQIYNGGMANSPTVGTDNGYCGTTAPPDFTSQSHEIRIEFHTDSSSSAGGFRMEFNTSAEGCGGLLHAQSGTVESPNHPADYPTNTECIWDINVANGFHIELNFLPPFDLEIQEPCSNDYVEISQYRQNGSLEVIHRFCGNVMPPSAIKSDSNRMIVKFRSNNRIQGNGFKADFTAVCGAIYTEERGTILSPGYPNNYDNNLDCGYTIISDPQRFIVLQFTEFAVEGVRFKDSSWGDGPLIDYPDSPHPIGPQNYPHGPPRYPPGSATCQYDYLQVFEGNDTDGSPVSTRMCGSTVPQPASSLGMMHLQFVTDHMITDRGWKATYQTSECGGEFTEPTGTIKTPTQPDSYHHNANCTWVITVIPNRIVELKFNSFDIEAHTRCIYDWVAIYDGDTFDAPQIGRYCGEVIPDLIRTTSNTMLVNFITDSSVAKGGFEATYRTTYGEAQGCGGTFNSSSGTFGSLDADGNGFYEPNLNCAWQIMVPMGKVVFLQFLSFNLEDAYRCHYDYVEIRDGLYASDPLVGLFCGDTLPSNFTSASNVLYVKFYSDGSVNRPGFNASFTAVNSVCGGVATATEEVRSIASPGYPNAPYPQNIRCRWTIDAPEDSQVYAEVDFMEIEQSTDCENDYLELRDFPMTDDGKSVHLCGNSTPAPFTSFGRNLQINFVTDFADPRRGFHLNYHIATCNRTYTGDNGQVWSPGHPANYPTNIFCEFSIQVPEGNSLSIFFNRFYVEQSGTCSYDYLKVFNGSSSSDTLIGSYCGNVLPNPVTVPGNVLFFQFATDYSVTHEGYDITYTSSPNGCGGTLSGIGGSFASPGYPGNSPKNQTCAWLISVPARRVITLEFTSFNVDGSGDTCGSNYVKIYNGASASSQIMATHCGPEQPAQVISSTNKLYVEYSSDSTSSGTGFYAKYTS